MVQRRLSTQLGNNVQDRGVHRMNWGLMDGMRSVAFCATNLLSYGLGRLDCQEREAICIS